MCAGGVGGAGGLRGVQGEEKKGWRRLAKGLSETKTTSSSSSCESPSLGRLFTPPLINDGLPSCSCCLSGGMEERASLYGLGQLQSVEEEEEGRSLYLSL